MARTALITGVMGQDGAYLARLLLEQGYSRVWGGTRRREGLAGWRLAELGVDREVEVVHFDLMDQEGMRAAICEYQPDEVYNLAAQSIPIRSLEDPIATLQMNGTSVALLLHFLHTFSQSTRFYQASTSEIYGNAASAPQTEETTLHPRNPYGVAKALGHWTTANYRDLFGLHASSGILFNHESPLRGTEYVTRKITASLANIKHRHQEVLELGNLNSQRDWGFAGDYVRGMWLMLQQEQAGEYVLATGRLHSVRDFVNVAATCLGFDLEWEGEGVHEVGIDRKSDRTVVRVNPAFYRPKESHPLVGWPYKAEERLGWRAETSFEELVEMMAIADNDRAAKEMLVI